MKMKVYKSEEEKKWEPEFEFQLEETDYGNVVLKVRLFNDNASVLKDWFNIAYITKDDCDKIIVNRSPIEIGLQCEVSKYFKLEDGFVRTY